jgi:hypothetical protein
MAHLTLFNVGICLVVALGSFSYGFGFGVFISSVGEPGFYSYFDLDRESPVVMYLSRTCSETYYRYSYGPINREVRHSLSKHS